MAVHRPTPKDVMARTEGMFEEKRPFEPEWGDIRNWIMPSAGAFYNGTPEGHPGRDQIVDSVGEYALEALSAGIQASVFNPATVWLEQRLVGHDGALTHEERVWLDDTRDIQMQTYGSPASRFQVAVTMGVREFSAFGNGCVFEEERPGHFDRMPLFSAIALAELAIAENADGEPGEIARRFQMSAARAVEKWGLGNVGGNIAKAFGDGKLNEKFWFRHLVMPNGARDARRVDNRNFEFSSHTISEADKDDFVSESGFHEQPYIFFRWTRDAGQLYARGPGGRALAEVRMSQRVKVNTIQAAEKALNPPLAIADESVVDGDPDLRPAAPNYIDYDAVPNGRAAIEPILTGAQPLIGVEFLQFIHKGIEQGFLKPLLQLERDPKMTATQSLILEEEQLRGLAPLIGHLEAEMLGTLHARTFGILQRAGKFPPAPESLQRKHVRAAFVSPSARAQKLSEVRALSQRLDIMLPMIQLKPELMDLTDPVATHAWLGRTLGVPAQLDRTAEEFAALQQAQADARNQATQVDQTASLMAAAGKGAPALDAVRAAAGDQGAPDLDANAGSDGQGDGLDNLVAQLTGAAPGGSPSGPGNAGATPDNAGAT